MTAIPVVLASTSRYRRSLLERLEIPFEAIASPFDEEHHKNALAGLDTETLAMALARGKAEEVAKLRPDALVLGADQIVEFEGVRLDKPGSKERACAQLARLQGKTHRIVTAMVAQHGASGRIETAIDVHELQMRVLTEEQIRAYVERDQPLDCCGSYRTESLGIALFERITGNDATAVVGLSLVQTVSLLQRFGVSVL